MRTVALALGLLLAGTVIAGAAGPRTIVGKWGVTPEECGTTGAFVIAPQAIVTDEMSCSLPDVTRSGDVVTFKGRCDSPGEIEGPETVVATRRGELLDLAFMSGGGRYRGLVPCRRSR